MYTQTEKSKGNKDRANANCVAQKTHTGNQCFKFADNRPEFGIQQQKKSLIKESVAKGSVPEIIHPPEEYKTGNDIVPTANVLSMMKAKICSNGCGCESCSAKIVQRVSTEKYTGAFQLKKNTPIQLKGPMVVGNMEAVAGEITHGSKSVTAIGKNGDNYTAYLQGGKDPNYTDPYENLTLDTIAGGKGETHAEAGLLRSTGTSYDKVVASKPICKRCEAMLTDESIERGTTSGLYSDSWKSHTEKNISVTDPYPYRAKNGHNGGTTGERWSYNSGEVKENSWYSDRGNTSW